MTIIPQIVSGGVYDLFSHFYYLKHYHNRNSRFIQADSVEGDVVGPTYKNDNKLLKIYSLDDYPFHRLLNHFSSKYCDEDVYLSVSGIFSNGLMKMLRDVSTHDLSYRDAFGSLKHKLEFKLMVADDRIEITSEFMLELVKLLPKKFMRRIYTDDISEYGPIVETLDKHHCYSFESIPKFYELCSSKMEMVYYFNNHFDNISEELVYLPIFELMNK